MWISLLLLYAQFAVGLTGDTDVSMRCPIRCSCATWPVENSTYIGLNVDCQERGVDSGQLSDELDTMLASNLTYGRLWWLTIVNSPLRHVPRSICQLTTLTELRLDNNQLTRLPDNCLTNLSNLVYFTAFNNKIETLQDGVFGGLENLKHLSLSNNRISSVGLSVFSKLSNLTRLALNDNKLTRLPDNFLSNLSSLVYFTASTNAIDRLQDGVFDGITNLKYLYLTWNNISSIGSLVFATLSNLTRLSLSNNQLNRLPDNCLANLSNLVYFEAYNNIIETLQNGVFDGLTKLKYLDLSRNRINSIGLSVFANSSNLSDLFTILLFGNKLTSLEPWIYDRAKIGSPELCEKVRIDLRHNEISKFTNKMGYQSHFSAQYGQCSVPTLYADVDMRDNQILHIEDILNGWQLNRDALRSCNEIEDDRMNFVIDIRRNNILCDCVNYNFYRDIASQNKPYRWRMFKVQLTCNLTDPITKMSSIMKPLEQDLNPFVCQSPERCPPKCVCVHRPANATLHVYCSNKNLTKFPNALPDLPDSGTKYKLDFSNNKLLRSLEYRDYFVNTEILDVSNCSVDDLADWEKIVKIPSINLFRNKITSLTQSVNITTGNLNLAKNLWDCSCDKKWMSRFFRSIADRLTQEVRCYSPPRLHDKIIADLTDEDFCVDPASEAASKATKSALTTSIPSVVAVVIAFLTIVGIMYRLRVKLYTRWKFHPFDRDECVGEDMEYDLYFLCSSDDDVEKGRSIVEQLVRRGYRVCYPFSEYQSGSVFAFTENAVVRSKRTVCLLTEHFCQSPHCMHELDVALRHNIGIKRMKRVIVLMALDNPNYIYANDATDMASLRQYLRQYKYIDYNEDDCLDHLLYALPIHGMDEADTDDALLLR